MDRDETDSAKAISNSIPVKIRLGASSTDARIELAGVDITSYLQGLVIYSFAGKLTTIDLISMFSWVEIDGPARVLVNGREPVDARTVIQELQRRASLRRPDDGEDGR